MENHKFVSEDLMQRKLYPMEHSEGYMSFNHPYLPVFKLGSGANAFCLIPDACKYIKLAENLNIMVEPREINMGTRYVAFCNWQGTTIASSTPSCDLNYLDKTRKDALYNLYRKLYWTFRLFMLGISQVNTVEDFFEEFIV